MEVPLDVEKIEEIAAQIASVNDYGEPIEGASCMPRFLRVHNGKPVKFSVMFNPIRKYDLHLLVQLPKSKNATKNATSEKSITASFRTLVDIWNPDFAYACDYEFGILQSPDPSEATSVDRPIGWLTFINASTPIDTAALSGVHQVTQTAAGTWIQLSGTPEDPRLEEALLTRRALGYDQ